MAMSASEEAVWKQTTTTGFQQQVFVMYHSTHSHHNAESIAWNGLKISQGGHNMLGDGLYVSRTPAKAARYGPVTFKLLVYPGRVCRIEYQGHPLQKTWQNQYGSAWVPPDCGMVNSGLEENCVKSVSQVRILGVTRGWECLSHAARRHFPYVWESNQLDDGERNKLRHFLYDQCLVYSKWRSPDTGFYFYDDYHRGFNITPENSNEPNMYWTRTWDNCIENWLTGRVVLWNSAHNTIETAPHDYDREEISRDRKWRLLPDGVVVSKEHNAPLVCQMAPDGNTFNLILGGSGQHYSVFSFEEKADTDVFKDCPVFTDGQDFGDEDWEDDSDDYEDCDEWDTEDDSDEDDSDEDEEYYDGY